MLAVFILILIGVLAFSIRLFSVISSSYYAFSLFIDLTIITLLTSPSLTEGLVNCGLFPQMHSDVDLVLTFAGHQVRECHS